MLRWMMLSIAVFALITIGCEKQPPAPPTPAPDDVPAPADPTAESADEAPQAKAAPTGDDVKREVGEAIDVTGEYTAAKTRELIAAAKVQLAEMDKQLDTLTEKTKEKSKSSWQKLKAEYEQKKQAAAEKMDKLKEAGGESWSAAKENMSKALDETKNTYEAMKKALLEDEEQPEQPITTEQ